MRSLCAVAVLVVLAGCYASHTAEGSEPGAPILCPLATPIPAMEGTPLERPLMDRAALCRERGLAVGDELWTYASGSPGAGRCTAERVDDGFEVRTEVGGPLAIFLRQASPCPVGSGLPDPLRVRYGDRDVRLALEGHDAVCLVGDPDGLPRDAAPDAFALCAVFSTTGEELPPFFELEVAVAIDLPLGQAGCTTRVDRRTNRIVIEPRYGLEPTERPVAGIRCVVPMLPECSEPWTLVVGDRTIPWDAVLSVDACFLLR